jgi:predicted nucleic acid-binding protein
MRADRFTALLDADVTAGALPRNVLLSLAEAGFFRPRWSAQILDETELAIAKILSDRGDALEEAARQRARIERAFPEALVLNYEPLIKGIELPDPGDTHVVAAAVQTRASVIVTNNLKDFPDATLNPLGLQARSADNFIADVIDIYTPGAVAALRTMRQRFKRPELDAEALIRRFENAGLTQSANLLFAEIESL